MPQVCVYCASRSGSDPRFMAEAGALGRALARAGLGLVYGGARVGLMGAVADAALASGGEVTGVIPQTLIDREVAHTGLTRQYVVQSMHERKARFLALSDAVCVLPGGLGTLDELFEVWTWSWLGLAPHPIVIINPGGYWDELLAFLDKTVALGMVDGGLRQRPIVVPDSAAAVAAIQRALDPA